MLLVSHPSESRRQHPLVTGLARSLLPLAVLALLGSTLLWGPYGLAVAALAWWLVLTRLA